MGINLEVPLEMLPVGVYSSTAGVSLCDRSRIKLNPDDYDGATYYFEVIAYSTGTVDDIGVRLYDETASASLCEIGEADGLPAPGYRLYSLREEFTASWSGDHLLALQFPQGESANAFAVWTARIIVIQEDATKTRIQYPLNGTYSIAAVDTGVYVDRRAATSYAYDTGRARRFLKEAGVNSTISSWDFEALLCGTTSNTAYAELRNLTDGASVTGSEVNTGGFSEEYIVCTANFADDAANFHDGDIFVPRVKSSDTSYAYLAGAYLYANLTSLTKAQVHYRVGVSHPGLTSGPVDRFHGAVLWMGANYSSPTVYFERTGYCNEDIDASAISDNGIGWWAPETTAPSVVGGSEVNWNSGTIARHRTGEISLTDGHYYLTRHLPTTNAEYCLGGLVLVINAVATTTIDDIAFESSLAGLNPGTEYHIRAYAVNSDGVGYGDVVSFVTDAGGSGGIQCGAPELAGSGSVVTFVGTGALSAGAATVSGIGGVDVLFITGTGAIQTGGASISGSGESPKLIDRIIRYRARQPRGWRRGRPASASADDIIEARP